MVCAVPGTSYFAPLLRELETSPLASSAAPALATATSGGTSGPASSSAAAAAAVDAASLNFTAFVPGASGVVGLSLAGASLAQSSYAVGHAEATQLRAVLRTAHAYALSDGYHDRNAVLVAFQLSDAEGNTAVERSGLAVRLVLTNMATGGNAETSSNCPSPDAASGLATCSCTVPAGWFSTAAAGSVSARLEVYYGHGAGPLRLEQPAGSVVLHRAPVHSALDATGMTLALPASPRFVGDRFTARASASLIGVTYKLRSWYVAFYYDAALLRLDSHQQDALWGDATVNTDEAGVLKMLVLSPANGDADADSALLGGRDIPLATLTFVVQAAAAGTHGSAVSLSILSMTNFGTVTFVENRDALVLDGRDVGHATGQLEVEAAAAAGMFAYFAGGSTWLQNTAPLTGADVSKGVLVRSASTRPADADSSDATATCTSDAGSTVLTLSGCTALGTAAASEGGAATITALVNDLSVSVAWPKPRPRPRS
jgi:hypothetical protein